MDLSVIIVSYNTKELTIRTIESVGFDHNREIIVVDNASTDGSVEALTQHFGKKIHIIAREHNGGFAKANNEGIQKASGKYILLLNSDTIVAHGALNTMVKAMDDNPTIGILSCRLLNTDVSYQPQGGALPTFFNLSVWWLWPFPGIPSFIKPYQDPTIVTGETIVERGWVGGTAMLIRREVIDQIGLLDEKIFMYAEDVEYCLRARQKGWVVAITPKASITHIGGASGVSGNALFGELKGLLYLWRKHYPAWQAWVLHVIFLKGAILRWFLFGILLRKAHARALYGRIMHELT